MANFWIVEIGRHSIENFRMPIQLVLSAAIFFLSCRDRFTAKLESIREFLWKELATNNTLAVIKKVIRVIRGWVNYHHISYNGRKVNRREDVCLLGSRMR